MKGKMFLQTMQFDSFNIKESQFQNMKLGPFYINYDALLSNIAFKLNKRVSALPELL